MKTNKNISPKTNVSHSSKIIFWTQIWSPLLYIFWQETIVSRFHSQFLIIFYSIFTHNHPKKLDVKSRKIHNANMIISLTESKFYHNRMKKKKINDQNWLINCSCSAQKLLLSSDDDKFTSFLPFWNINWSLATYIFYYGPCL